MCSEVAFRSCGVFAELHTQVIDFLVGLVAKGQGVMVLNQKRVGSDWI